MPLLYQIDHSDNTFETYLRLYDDHVEIRKPKQSKYRGVMGMGRLALNMLGVAEAQYLDAHFRINEIEKVTLTPATRAKAGIIQFYLSFQMIHTKATYFDLAYRSDAINFKYSENDIASKIKQYVDSKL